MDTPFSYSAALAQSAFFYYTPDVKTENRQHGHFSQQHPQHLQMPVYHAPQHMQSLPSTPVYSRPTSSCSQPPLPTRILSGNGYPANMTPVASPRPVYHRPMLLIQDQSRRIKGEAELSPVEAYYNPATPPLSASGSSMSSPSSADFLASPHHALLSGDAFEGVKMGCEGEVQMENLAGEWIRTGSPPMTPVFVHPA